MNRVYGAHIHVFDVSIPLSVKASETTAASKSIYDYDPKGKAAAAYSMLTQEVMQNGD